MIKKKNILSLKEHLIILIINNSRKNNLKMIASNLILVIINYSKMKVM